MSLHVLANHMATKGRGPDSMLVHMSPEEVASLQALAMKHGGSLTINPDTGLPEAGWLKKLLPAIAGFALGPAGFGLMSAMGAGLTVGAVTGLATGSLEKGLMAGLGAYGGAGIGESLVGLGSSQFTPDVLANASKAADPIGTLASSATEVAPTGWEAAKAGMQTAVNNPSSLVNQMGGGLQAAKTFGMAAAPVIADQMVPTTVKAPPYNPGYIRPYDYDPRTQQFTQIAPVKAGFNTGGIVALADGGDTKEDPYARYNTLSGQSKAAYDYLMGNTTASSVPPKPPVVVEPTAPVVKPPVVTPPSIVTPPVIVTPGGPVTPVTPTTPTTPEVVTTPTPVVTTTPTPGVSVGTPVSGGPGGPTGPTTPGDGTTLSPTSGTGGPGGVAGTGGPGGPAGTGSVNGPGDGTVQGPGGISTVGGGVTTLLPTTTTQMPGAGTTGTTTKPSTTTTTGGTSGGSEGGLPSLTGSSGLVIPTDGTSKPTDTPVTPTETPVDTSGGIGDLTRGTTEGTSGTSATDTGVAGSGQGGKGDEFTAATDLGNGLYAVDNPDGTQSIFTEEGAYVGSSGGNTPESWEGAGARVGVPNVNIQGGNEDVGGVSEFYTYPELGGTNVSFGDSGGSGGGKMDFGNFSPYGDFAGDYSGTFSPFGDFGSTVNYYTAAKGGVVPGYAMGGGLGSLGGYSDGGRLLKGPGDGVSDSIPATIGAKGQPARLADGEFVVPARIVSELGNGSTDAGARKLYAMMDRIQKTRGKTVGKGKVATNSRADKHLPA